MTSNYDAVGRDRIRHHSPNSGRTVAAAAEGLSDRVCVPQNTEEVSEVRSDRRLLVLGCSARKLPDAGLLPAIERYDGPRYRVLRKFLREHLDAQNTLDVLILSAEFGLISGCDGVPFYDRIMSAERADQLAPQSTARFRQTVATGGYRSLFIEAGHEYLAALGGRDAVDMAVSDTQIAHGSPGQRLAALRSWLLAL